MKPPFSVRQMQADDLPLVLALQAEVYPPAYHEPAAVFASRLMLAPGFSQIACTTDKAIAGYLISHPWKTHRPPALFAPLNALPGDSSTLHIHDLAVHPRARGGTTAKLLLRRAVAAAQTAGLASAGLVAVAGAERYWAGLGFRVADIPSSGDFPGRYGAEARYMHAGISQLMQQLSG